MKIDPSSIPILIVSILMEVQTLQREIREYLVNEALNDLSILRWTLVEERMQGEDGADYLDALLAYRDAEIAAERASKDYRAFLVKYPEKHWEEEEHLYSLAREYKMEANRAHQNLMDLILESESYKEMVRTNPVEDLPDYG
jgi:hypothetical protein